VASFVNPISSTYSITGNSFGVSTTASQPYNLYTNTSGVDYGLVIANLSGSNGTITLSNNSTTFTTITSTSTGLTIGDAVNAGIITGTNFNMSFSSFFQSGLNTGINNNSANSSNPFIYFALNDTSNNQIIPLYIYYNSVLCNAILNMNYNNITNVNNLNFANGLTIQYDGYENYLYSNSSTNTLGGGLYFSCNGNVNGLYLTSSTSSSGRTIGLNAPINASFDLNMNNNDINNCNSVNSSGTLNLTGTSVLINGNAIPSQPTSGLSYPLISSVYVTNSTYPCTYGADQGVTYLSTVYNYNNQYIIINFQLYFIVPSNYPTGFNINPYQPAIFNYSTPLYPTTLTPTLVTNSISCINSSFSAYATSCTIGNITTVNPNIAYVSSSSIAFVPNVQTTFLPNQAYYIGGSITVYF
jgi:hypothetical protein